MENQRLFGALYAYNADASIVENEETEQEIKDFIAKCDNHRVLTPADGEDFETACTRLDLQVNQTNEVHCYWITNGECVTICNDWK